MLFAVPELLQQNNSSKAKRLRISQHIVEFIWA
jgi:hypothetical protein